jgi:hypothetical protein
MGAGATSPSRSSQQQRDTGEVGRLALPRTGGRRGICLVDRGRSCRHAVVVARRRILGGDRTWFNSTLTWVTKRRNSQSPRMGRK